MTTKRKRLLALTDSTSKPQAKRIAAPVEAARTQQAVVRKVDVRPIAAIFEKWRNSKS